MPIMTHREMVSEFETRHGQGVSHPESGMIYYPDGSVREPSGAGVHAEELDPLKRARFKVKYWESRLVRRRRELNAVRTRLDSLAAAIENGHSLNTAPDEAELERLLNEVRESAAGHDAATQELEAVLPPAYKKPVDVEALKTASRVRNLARRAQA